MSRWLSVLAMSSVLATGIVANVHAQTNPLSTPGLVPAGMSPSVTGHVEAAASAAGEIWQESLQNLCRISATLRTPNPPPAVPRKMPPLANWPVEPLKIFDNVYFVGSKGVSTFAIKTTQGIIITDGMWDYDMEGSVIGGLQKLGLNPADIKYVIIPHGHTDHYGGAQLLRDRFGAKIIAPRDDMQFMIDFLKVDPTPIPNVIDIQVDDGDTLTLGETTITFSEVPGHTPGSMTMLFPVTLNGQAHEFLIWAAGAGVPASQSDSLKKQIPAIDRLLKRAQAAGADAIAENHGAHVKVEQLRLQPGASNPFLVGTGVVTGYLKMRSECDQAQLAAFDSYSTQK